MGSDSHHVQPRDGGSVLVGRAREQALLRERLDAAMAGRGSLVLISGEAGIGKTALVAWLVRQAEDEGVPVPHGACFDLTDTPPYGPWIDLFATVPASPIQPRLPAPLGPGNAAPSQSALFMSASDALTAAAHECPLMLVLEDLHWADPASLDLLRAIARQAARFPVLLVATYRTEEVTREHPLYVRLPALVRETEPCRLDLRRLAPEAVGTLVQSRYSLGTVDEIRLLAFLEERAEGNPFFLGELLRSLEETEALRPHDRSWVVGDLSLVGLPSLVRQAIDQRLARLPAEDQQLLGVASVIGQEVPLELWRAVTGVDEDGLLDVVARAVAARMLEEVPDGVRVRFVHALIREALYQGLLPSLAPSRRRRWHQRIGEVLAAAPVPDPDAVAQHFQQASDPRAVEWLIRAGEWAHRSFAYLTAATRYEAALRLMSELGADARARGWLSYRLSRVLRPNDRPRSLVTLAETSRPACSGCWQWRIAAGSAACPATSLRGWPTWRPASTGWSMSANARGPSWPGWRSWVGSPTLAGAASAWWANRRNRQRPSAMTAPGWATAPTGSP